MGILLVLSYMNAFLMFGDFFIIIFIVSFMNYNSFSSYTEPGCCSLFPDFKSFMTFVLESFRICCCFIVHLLREGVLASFVIQFLS